MAGAAAIPTDTPFVHNNLARFSQIAGVFIFLTKTLSALYNLARHSPLLVRAIVKVYTTTKLKYATQSRLCPHVKLPYKFYKQSITWSSTVQEYKVANINL